MYILLCNNGAHKLLDFETTWKHVLSCLMLTKHLTYDRSDSKSISLTYNIVLKTQGCRYWEAEMNLIKIKFESSIIYIVSACYTIMVQYVTSRLLADYQASTIIGSFIINVMLFDFDLSSLLGIYAQSKSTAISRWHAFIITSIAFMIKVFTAPHYWEYWFVDKVVIQCCCDA